jgi:hypothetical protein
MVSAECSASPERQTSPTNALDLVLKYAAVFAALVYGVGFLEEIEYASWLGVGSVDFPLANPRYFAVGSLMLLACLWSVALVLPAVLPPGPWTIRRAGSDEETLRRLTKEMEKVNYAIATIAAFVLAFAGSHWAYFLPTVPALRLSAVVLLINAIALAIVRSPDRYFRLPIGHQLGVMLTLAALLAVFSVQCGYAHWCREAQTTGAKTRLLVAPEAVEGARMLGVVFSDEKRASGLPEVTEPVRVLFEGDRAYVLRLKSGTIVQLSKEKIWGIRP